MSRSDRRKLALLRSKYSRETYAAARAAVTRSRSLCLDECSQGQRRLRDIFAWWMLNTGGPYSGVPGINSYVPVFSPRYNQLVLVHDTPHNIATRLVPRKPPSLTTGSETTGRPWQPASAEEDALVRGLPGVRMVASTWKTVEVQDVVGGGRMVVTEHANRNQWRRGHDEPAPGRHADAWGPEVPIAPIERTRLDGVPHLPEGVAVLLRAILVRMEFVDAQRQWAASWFWDPLDRWDEDRSAHRVFERCVSGSGRRWRLEWTGYPCAADLAAMLTDAVVGLRGTVAHREGHEAFDLACQGSVLELRPIAHATWPDAAQFRESAAVPRA
jgi:hypothetical protein